MGGAYLNDGFEIRNVKLASKPSPTSTCLGYQAAPTCLLFDAVNRNAGPHGELNNSLFELKASLY